MTLAHVGALENLRAAHEDFSVTAGSAVRGNRELLAVTGRCAFVHQLVPHYADSTRYATRAESPYLPATTSRYGERHTTDTEVTMPIPTTYTSKNETGCCAVPNVDAWQKQTFDFEDKSFIREHTRSALYVPLNMGSTMTKLQTTAAAANAAMPPDQAMTLSRDLSPWKAEHLYAVTQPIPGADNVSLSGRFVSMVFEGPFKNAKTWYEDTASYALQLGLPSDEVYLFYTTCPKCAKYYGKNYVIGMAKVS